MAKQSLIREFLLFIRHEKKWWLIPFLTVLLIVGVLLLVVNSSGAFAPFLYPLF